MVRTVVLLRHAMPAVDPTTPPGSWTLSDAGRRAAATLRPQLPQDALLISSDERKAVETVALASGRAPAEVPTDSRFAEVSRPGERFADDVRDGRAAWIAGRLDDRHVDWESVDTAGARFAAGLADLAADTAVIGTHGMVITAWLITTGLVAPGDPAAHFWSSLRFPDLITVDLKARTILARAV